MMTAGKLFLSACLATAGLVGFLTVIRMGVLPPDNPMGHSREYAQGWALFFLLMLGVPCFLAFIGGLTPWVTWLLRRYRGRGAPREQNDSGC